MATKLLIIHSDVKSSDTFTQSLLNDTAYISLNGQDTELSFQDKLSSLSLGALTNVALVFDNRGGRAPFFEWTEAEFIQEQHNKAEYNQKLQKYSEELKEYNAKMAELRKNKSYTSKLSLPERPPIYNSIKPSFLTSTLFFSPTMMRVIEQLKVIHPSLSVLDLITCNVRSSSQFTELNTAGITVRYSTNITGRGGDWVLESHNINVTPVYFTDAVRRYPFKLGAVAPTQQDSNGFWLISTPDNLYWLMTTSSVVAPAPNLTSNYKLTNNIDMTAYPDGALESIGKYLDSTSYEFGGTFEGNNYTITLDDNLVSDYQGLFGNINNTGIIRNLNVVYTKSVSLSLSENISYIGLLCGTLNGSAINCNVYANQNISIAVYSVSGTVGGFSGIVSNGRIINCSLNIYENAIFTTSSTLGPFVFSASDLGGFIGSIYSSTVSGSVLNSTLTVFGNMSLISYGATATDIDPTTLGGFAGQNLGTIDNSTLNINGNLYILDDNDIVNNYTTYMGGFSGLSNVLNNSTLNVRGTMTMTNDCSSANHISYSGGMCGSNSKNLQNCTANISGNITHTHLSEVPYIGGFVAYSNNIIDACILNASNDIIMNAANATSGYIGGFGGQIQQVNTIRGCNDNIGGNLIINVLDSLYISCFIGYIIGATTAIISNCSSTITGNSVINCGNLNKIAGFISNYLNAIYLECNVTIGGNLTVAPLVSSNSSCYFGGFVAIDDGTGLGFNNSSITVGGNTSITITDNAYIGGFVAEAGNIYYSNCSATYNGTVLFQVPTGATGDCYIGAFSGDDIDANEYAMCTANYNRTTTFLNKTSGNIYLASPIGNPSIPITFSPNITVKFGGTPLIFYNNSSTSIEYNGQTYNIGDSFVVDNLTIDVSDLTVTINVAEVVSSISAITSIPPCCQPICPQYNQTTNNTQEEVTIKHEATAIASDVDSTYAAINANRAVNFIQPAFKSYREYMIYLQSKYR